MKLIRLKKVSELTGLGRSSIYNYMTEGRFPKSVELGSWLMAWVEEVEDWIAARIGERDCVAL